MDNPAFGPINPRPNYPNWQTRLIRPAVQFYRDRSYEEIAYLLAPDETFTVEQLQAFTTALGLKLEQMRTHVRAIRRILLQSPYYPYRYRDEHAIEAFQDWIELLTPFTSQEETRRMDHHILCEDSRCLRYRCLFHTANSEASIRVYRSDFDVMRYPVSGMLREVAVLIPRTG